MAHVLVYQLAVIQVIKKFPENIEITLLAAMSMTL
jgi:hypothetical protein